MDRMNPLELTGIAVAIIVGVFALAVAVEAARKILRGEPKSFDPDDEEVRFDEDARHRHV